jgi:hypothetical protein
MRFHSGLWCVLALAACDHTDPFRPAPYGAVGPLDSGPVERLTFSAGQDLQPVWEPGSRNVLYARERLDRSDRDHCVTRLPGDGGSITGQLCDQQPAAGDSTDAYAWPAPAGDGSGRVAYTRATSLTALGSLAPHDQQLVVGTFDPLVPARVLLGIPYQGPSGRGHEAVAQIRWLTPTSLVYVGQRVFYNSLCSSCPVDTIPTGLELVRLDFTAATPVLQMLPGSDLASSVAVAGSDTVYFTVDGDSRVWRLLLSSSALGVVHDFGTIVRDVQVAGARLVVVGGGVISFSNDSVRGPVQQDGGGDLLVLNLTSGLLETTIQGRYRHPALSPSGDRVVTEVVTDRTTDLWGVTLP